MLLDLNLLVIFVDKVLFCTFTEKILECVLTPFTPLWQRLVGILGNL